jgi:hypothetical protein
VLRRPLETATRNNRLLDLDRDREDNPATINGHWPEISE